METEIHRKNKPVVDLCETDRGEDRFQKAFYVVPKPRIAIARAVLLFVPQPVSVRSQCVGRNQKASEAA